MNTGSAGQSAVPGASGRARNDRGVRYQYPGRPGEPAMTGASGRVLRPGIRGWGKEEE